MRYFLLFLVIATAQLSFGQHVDSVSKIVFRYGIGHNSFGQRGIYDKEEEIEVTKFNGDNFKFSKYTLVTRYDRGDGSKSISDTNDFNVEGLQIISKVQIERLFIALNITKDNFDSTFVTPYLKKPTQRKIFKIAQESDLYYKFQYDHMDNDDRKESGNNIKKIQNFDKLNMFLLLNKPDPGMTSVTSDAWNYMRISCINKKDTINFDSQLFQVMGQPIEKFKKGRYDFDKGIVNLEVNVILADFLPRSSLLKENIVVNALTEKYIEWYLKEKL